MLLFIFLRNYQMYVYVFCLISECRCVLQYFVSFIYSLFGLFSQFWLCSFVPGTLAYNVLPAFLYIIYHMTPRFICDLRLLRSICFSCCTDSRPRVREQSGCSSHHQTALSTRRHRAHPVYIIILHPRDASSTYGHKLRQIRNTSYIVMHYVRRLGNAMPHTIIHTVPSCTAVVVPF